MVTFYIHNNKTRSILSLLQQATIVVNKMYKVGIVIIRGKFKIYNILCSNDGGNLRSSNTVLITKDQNIL